MSNYYSSNELINLGINIIGTNVFVSRFCNIYNPHNLTLHSNIRIDDFCVISCKGLIEICDYVHISAQCFISSSTKIYIGKFSAISVGVKIFGATDDFSGEYLVNPTIPSLYTNVINGDIIINDFSVIGSNSVIMPNIVIDYGVSIGANSFVNKSCDSWKIYAGTPIKFIKNKTNKCIHLANKLLNGSNIII
jgi:acetyltransferase-like isoleucine patch superfamily enzyme